MRIDQRALAAYRLACACTLALVMIDILMAKVANYYFGVRANEATPSRKFFQPGSGLTFTLGLHCNYDFGGRTTILFGYEASVLAGPIANSPIVVNRLNNLFYAGYDWRLK
jgi:outer membrane scaffolding protein for murein synthesis (MipA/OmpV family)